MKENKNKILIIVLILSLIINICLVGFIIYKNSNDKKLNKINEKNEENNINEKQKLKVTEDIAQKLYYDIFHDGEQKITADGFSVLNGIYHNKKIVYTKDIEFGDIIGILFFKLPKDKVQSSFKELPNYKYQENNKFLISDIEEIYNFYFGEKEEWTNFETGYPLGTCNIKDEYYECKIEHEGFGFETDDISFLSTFDKYDTDNENLYIYERSIYYYGGDWDGETETGFYTNYIDGELKDEVVELRGKKSEALLENKFKDKFLTYKHTFKQNSDGTFYLYSTEPIIK